MYAPFNCSFRQKKQKINLIFINVNESAIYPALPTESLFRENKTKILRHSECEMCWEMCDIIDNATELIVSVSSFVRK